jgi:hypothetical protein
MADEQVIFEQTLAAIEAEVRGFGSYTDIRTSKDVEVHRLMLSKKLDNAKLQVATFNSREMLFEHELTDYSQFDIIMEQWSPFNLLWKTTYLWLTSYDTWMNGPFDEVNGMKVEELGKSIQSLIQSVIQSVIKA